MAIEKTLAIIKPDGVARNLIGAIIGRIEQAGLSVRAMKLTRLTAEQAGGFYAVHRARPFFGELCEIMSSGPVVLLLLEGEQAITRWRELMGATNPAKAAPGTIRGDLGVSIEENTVHGSDAPETAAFESSYFFNAFERVG